MTAKNNAHVNQNLILVNLGGLDSRLVDTVCSEVDVSGIFWPHGKGASRCC